MFLTLGIKILLLVSMGTRNTYSAFANMQKKYTRLNKRKKCDIKKFLHIYLHRKPSQESANGLPGVKCLHGKGSYEQSEHTARRTRESLPAPCQTGDQNQNPYYTTKKYNCPSTNGLMKFTETSKKKHKSVFFICLFLFFKCSIFLAIREMQTKMPQSACHSQGNGRHLMLRGHGKGGKGAYCGSL